MTAQTVTRLITALLGILTAQAGPVANGGFDNNPQTPAAINPWQTHNGSRIALTGCSTTTGTSVTCASAVGLVAGMRLSGSGLVTNPSNATLIVALPVTSTSFAVSGGTITTCPSALLGSNAVPPPTLVVGRTTGQYDSPPFSLRVDGRDSAIDGAKQSLSGLTNGTRYTTRFAIKLDAPAQVRCLLAASGATPPIILAEKVVDATQVGQWVRVEGTATLSLGAGQTGGQLLFAVEQIYGQGAAAPAGVFPGYNLDTVAMEVDTDGDGYWDIEEVPANTNTNPLLADSDADGLPDKWEGANSLAPDQDNDGDGHSNKTEYWANTDPLSAASYPGIPGDPLASTATKALLYHLQTRGARGNGKYLTGQHAHDIPNDDDYNDYVVALNTLMTNAGVPSWVSVLGITAEGPTAAQPLQIATSGPVGRAYMDAGGLVVLHFTPRNPWTNNFNGDKTGVDIANLLTPGTTANLRMIGWMDAIAAELALFGPDRPVIFRPFSEQNGGWNWYGRLQRDEFIALYRWFRDYFVNTKDLHNIIWTIEHHVGVHRAASTSNIGVSVDYYYPGDDVIDLVGFSAYTSGWNPGFDSDAQSRLHPKAFAITEGGPPPNEDDVPNAYNSTYLPALDAWYPRAAFFVIWNSWPTGPYVAIKDNANYVALLTDPRVTNREALFWRAPGGLSASAASSTQFSLNWSATTAATGYALESSANGGPPWLPAGTSSLTTSTAGGFSASTTRHFRVRALYPGGDSAPLGIASATTWSLFQQWKNDTLGNFAAPDLGDDDGDGLVTLLEYGFGTHPLTTSPPPAQSLVNVSGADYLALTFRRRAGPSGLKYIVEATGDLLNGPWLPEPVQFGTPADNGDGTETVTFRDIVPTGSTPSRFVRLNMNLP
jgi:Glycosyl hydrolase family 26